MVDSVISTREIYEDYAGDFPCFKAIFDLLGAEASLLWYKEKFDNWRQAAQYQALVQFVEMTQKENLSEAFRARWVLGFRRTTTRACLQSIGKR